MSYQPTTSDNLAADIARLMIDLAEMSAAKHNAAVALNQDGLIAKGYESQSHAYANAAMWLEQIVEAHSK